MLRVLGWGEKVDGRLRLRMMADRLLRPLMLMGLMCLLMRAELFDRCAPFGAALMAAGLAAGESPAALVLGCLLGMLRLPLSQLPILPGLCCAAVLAGEILFSSVSFLRGIAPETRVCGMAGFAVLIPALAFAGGELLPSLRALACAAIAATAAPFFLPALGMGKKRRRLMLQERVGAALLALACISGMALAWPPLARGASLLALLAAPGAGTGVLCGVALAFGGGMLAEIAPLALFGLVTGWRHFTARWHRSLALMISSGIFTLATRGSPLDLLCPAAAGIFYMILPESVLAAVSLVADPEPASLCEPDRVAREVTAQSRQRLLALGDAFAEMARGCAAPTDIPGEQELICEMRSRLCADCPGYADCWAGGENRAVRFLCQLITEALERVDAPPGMRVLFSDGEIPPDVLRVCRRGRMIPDRLGLLLWDFAEKRRAELKRCATDQLLSVQLTQAREILCDLAEKQAAPVCFHGPRLEQLHAALDSAGIGDCEAAALGFDQAQIRLTRPGPWTRAEISRASSAFARAFGGGFTPELSGESLVFTQRTRFRAETGVSCQSGVAGESSGDSHLIHTLGQKLYILLSDGMGSGSAACAESAETLRLLWCFLRAGISRPLALETVNQQMLMRSGEELYATVDLCVIDLHTGAAELTKLAASRSILLRGTQTRAVEGGRLPLGILERVQPAVTRLRLRPGDTLILGTDGVMEADDGLLIERAARCNAGSPPDTLARILVHEAAQRRPHGRSDDMTCVCVRLDGG